jgi:FtsP/CotA-like multicopper oxidase with cupredoxin domain
MSSSARIGILVATVVVLVLGFIVLSPGDDDEPKSTAAPTATTAAPPPAGTTTVAPEPEKPAAPKYTPVVVRDGKPVGGVQKIEVKNGDRVRLQVSSPDTSDEIHIHGYDLMKDLKAGGRIRFAFTANADGIFEIELEDAGVQIAELVVEP